MPEQKLLKVFLCHASEDKPTVRDLYRRLKEEGWIDVWLDVEKILPGQAWDLEIKRAVEQADVVLACISGRSVSKEGYIQRELRAVLDLAEEKPEDTIFVIPLKLENCEVPRTLQNWQWEDYFPSSQRNRAYNRVLESLRRRAETLQIPVQKAKESTQLDPATARAAALAPKRLARVVEVELLSGRLHPEARPHAFVIMPFGKKKSSNGTLYDFNAIYIELIKPSVEMAGFEAFRADEEATSGDILTDMFQELLLADLCIADMSLDNANVFYELGIRHAFRKRGVVHIQAGQAYMPFDVFNVRTIPYHITAEGVPDPAFLERDKAALIRVYRATWSSEPERVHSPVYNLLTGLVEPERKTLRTPLATGFWREYNEWKQRVTIAQRQKRIGDILLLTEEIQNPLIKEEAISEAGRALMNMGRNELALAQYRKGLEVNPRNLTFRREEAFNLNKLGRVDEAIRKIELILYDYPTDTETLAYLARLYKEKWMDSWMYVTNTETRLKEAFDSRHWLIRSFQTYLRSFLVNLNEFYPGVNAVTLGAILIELADRYDDPNDPDPEVREVREKQTPLIGTLELLLEEKAAGEKEDYWTLISLAELRVFSSKSISQVVRAYRKAAVASRENTFFLQSSIAQLEVLQSLQLRHEFVQAGIDVLSEELRRSRGEYSVEEEVVKEKKVKGKAASAKKAAWRERMIFLFTGYMVNHARKMENQFPPDNEEDIRAAIESLLDKYNAGSADLAVTTGMDAGSEILFVESCVERGIPVAAYFPLSEAPYIRDFVSPGGEQWVERFYQLRNHPLVIEFYQPDQVGLPKEGDNLHERNNRWALYSALARGIENVRLIAVWDGKNEIPKDLDARLVRHMVELMRDAGGIIEQINPLRLTPSSVKIGKAGKPTRK